MNGNISCAELIDDNYAADNVTQDRPLSIHSHTHTGRKTISHFSSSLVSVGDQQHNVWLDRRIRFFFYLWFEIFLENVPCLKWVELPL